MSNFIIEQAIFQEGEIVKLEPKKAVFRMIMQTVDEVNQNKRIYPRPVLTEAMDQCATRMRRRAFFGELDHPCPQGNDEFDTIRQTTVMLKEVSHIIRDYEFRGNRLVGEIETTTTPNGNILLGLLKDRAGVGLSMRGLAELDRKPEYNEVKSPLTIISFDGVSLPSHSAAVVDFNEMKFESHLLQEKAGLICIDGTCFMPEYFDKLVERKIITFFDRWI